MSDLFSNKPGSTLASSIVAADTTLVLQTGTGSQFPAPLGGDGAPIALTDGTLLEYVRCTDRSGDNMTVQRGLHGSTALNWGIGTRVESWILKQWMDGRTRQWSSLAYGKNEGWTAVNSFENGVPAPGDADIVTIPSEAGHPGIIQGQTGTSATGRAGIRGNTATLLLGNGEFYWHGIVRIPTLSTSGERYSFRIGTGDADTGEHTDGVYFEYDEAVDAHWQAVSANNSTRTKTVISSVTVTAGQWYNLRILVNAAGTSVRYFIDNVLVATHTTNIPTATGRETSAVNVTMVKSVGTTSRTWDLDVYEWRLEFTTPR